MQELFLKFTNKLVKLWAMEKKKDLLAKYKVTHKRKMINLKCI